MYRRRFRRRLTVKDKAEQFIDNHTPFGGDIKEVTGKSPREWEETYGHHISDPVNVVTGSSTKRKSPHENPYNKRQRVSDQRRGYIPRTLDFGEGQQRRPPMKVIKRTANRTKFRSQLGSRKKSSVRKIISDWTFGYADDKTLSVYRAIRVPYNASEKVINARNDLLINLKGVKVSAWFQLNTGIANTNGLLAYPVTVRWALVNPKENNGGGILDTSQFVVERDPTTKSTGPFPTTGTSFDYTEMRINREEFGVLKEGSFQLIQNSNDNTRMGDNAMKRVDVWVPINRQFEFLDNTTTYPEENLYWVWWYCQSADSGTVKKFTGANALVGMWGEHTAYFTNSRLYN